MFGDGEKGRKEEGRRARRASRERDILWKEHDVFVRTKKRCHSYR